MPTAPKQTAIPRQRSNWPTTRTISIGPEAADIVAEVVTAGWKTAVAEQLAKAVSDGFWKDASWRSRRRGLRCQPLADVADFMEKLMKLGHDAVGAVARRGVGLLGRTKTEQRLAEAFAKKIPLPGDKCAAATINALRVTGVWVCADTGVDIATRCPCFWALAKDKTKDELKEVLERKLDMLSSGKDE